MIVTIQQHIMFEQRRRHPEASGRLSWLLSGITLATKMIESKIRRLGLTDEVIGSAGVTNVQGEAQQKLDVYANRALLHCLGVRDSVAALVSEENEEPFVFDRAPETGEYIIVFDPLDGSSNIDVNVNVGTIFFDSPQARYCRNGYQCGRSPARRKASGRRIRCVWTVHYFCLHNGRRGLWLHTRSGHWRVRPEPRPNVYAEGRQYLFRKRGECRQFPSGIQELLCRSSQEWLHLPLHWIFGG